ncbi:hypothetical protein PVAP13_7KG178900 [Panicum virgatum]|uniref:Peptidase A1 domain-containing protein n=1 Tax=Panicum virgatum TaxID=38727 RepID=A0A8T0QMT9_PANVG|nr:hypothetical protein PVAP13_7KG178900 [Panicum virgatum]
MAHCNLLVANAAVVLFLAVGTEASSGGIGFKLHHRFSPVVGQWMEARGHAPGLPDDAPKGSREYHSALLRHDRAVFARRRGLANADGQRTLTFADGNATRLDTYEYLHYAEVEVGTPSSKFLVALDTGSDLFWLPCECKVCVNTTTGLPYSPSRSSTSKAVPCGHPLCERPDACGAGAAGTGSSSSSCPYEVKYVSANTGSSGVLVEDVLHLVDGGGKAVQAPIVFGCGQVQTGDFLRGAAAGGLMGLGMDKVSVPSALASSGLVGSDSFSMCFSRDGVGRINFGDAGSPDQAETPFIAAGSLQHPYYNISVGAITVDSKAMAVEFTAIVDSGTSYTYLNDPAYTLFTTNFNSRVSEARDTYGSGYERFEYCYRLSPGQTSMRRLPAMSLTTKGGAVFPVTWPIIPVLASTNDGPYHPIGYCLGVIKNSIFSTEDATIGQNFMTGLKVVFDRRRSVLGWEKFDCYKDTKMQDGGSPDTSLGSPAGDYSAPGSPNGDDYVPYVPLPWDGNTTDGPYYPGRVPLTWPARSGSGSSSRASFGGIFSLMLLLHVLAVMISVSW